jgi:hypothetical protein
MYDGSHSHIQQFNLETSQTWDISEQRASFGIDSKLCIAALIFTLKVPVIFSKCIIVLITAFSGPEDLAKIYQFYQHPKQNLGEAIKKICTGRRASSTRHVSVLGKKHFNIALSRQAMFDELACIVDISLDTEK